MGSIWAVCAEGHFYSELWSSVTDFCPNAWDANCQSAHKYSRAAFLWKVPSSKPMWRPEFLWDWSFYFPSAKLIKKPKMFANKLIHELQISTSRYLGSCCAFALGKPRSRMVKEYELAQQMSWFGITRPVQNSGDKEGKGIIQPYGISHANVADE